MLSFQKELFVESFHPCVSRLPINDDGSFGKKEIFTEDIAVVPDGLAFDKENNLFISCYEPSRIYMADPSGKCKLLIEDPVCTASVPNFSKAAP